MNQSGYTPRQQALAAIDLERARQEKLKQDGRFLHTMFDMGLQEAERLALIVEEIGEVSRNVQARAHLVTDGNRTDRALFIELTQVAALCCGWMERLVANDEPQPERRSGYERRQDHKTGKELTRLGVDDRREYQRRKALREAA
jgi:hypothetical protein